MTKLTAHIRRFFKPCVLIVPLFVYACVMYRILDGTCFTTAQRRHSYAADAFTVSERLVYKKLQEDNITYFVLQLLNDYEQLNKKQSNILQTLRNYAVNVDAIRVNKTTFKTNIGMTLNGMQKKVKAHSNGKQEYTSIHNSDERPRYIINCSNIHEISLKRKIGHGITKQTFQGDFNGMPVAVKMVTRHQNEAKSCIEKLDKDHPDHNRLRSNCFIVGHMKHLKEILLLQQLSHPGFVKMLGFCVRNEDSDTTDLSERGIASVFELGERITWLNFQKMTWRERLQHTFELADFLRYMEYSPLGSLGIRDFKEEHFLMVSGSLKMIDLDDVDNLEPTCTVYVGIETQLDLAKQGYSNGCEFNLTCQKGTCIGNNAKENFKKMHELFFKRLFSSNGFPKQIIREVGNIQAAIESNKITANDLINRLNALFTVMQ